MMTKLHNAFHIETYIFRPNVPLRGPIKTQNDRDRHFVSLDDASSVVLLIPEIDPNYILGGIRLVYEDEVIMDLHLWDSVDHLWMLILYMVENFLENKVAETDFPEGGAHISIAAIDENILLLTLDAGERNQWYLPTKEFIPALLDHARYFFQRMAIFFPDESYDDDFEIVGRIANTIRDYSRDGWWPFLIRGCIHNPQKYHSLLSETSECQVMEHFCYLDDNSSIARIVAKGSPSVWMGFLYFEYHNVPLFDPLHSYPLDALCRAMIKALATVIYEKKTGVVDIGVMQITIEIKNAELLTVVICQGDQMKRMEVSSKRFLHRMVGVISSVLIVVSTKHHVHNPEDVYEEEFSSISDMTRRVRLSSEE